LVATSGGVSASFAYDAFDRRVSRTVGVATTSYLYDGINSVQELSGGVTTANLLAGSGTDERFQRTDANGPANFLTDALGSTIALAGPGGNTIAQYTYDPYGNTTMTGNSSNPYQYTGRENDGAGLYYYRARYYDPQVHRFASEDPEHFQEVPNLYSYVADAPLDFTDPTGRVMWVCTRGGWQNVYGTKGAYNHVYFCNPATGENCGRGTQSGLESCPAKPLGGDCIPIPGSEGHEQQLMDCCKAERTKGHFPMTDCHDVLYNCEEKVLKHTVTPPGGRYWPRCKSWNCYGWNIGPIPPWPISGLLL
jgi:RHS repeat-associated protein